MDISMERSLREEAGKLFPCPAIAAKIVNLVTSNKPLGWSQRSNAPYYKKVYADELLPFIHKMMECGQPILYDYETWCTEESQVSPQTLYNRVNQSLRYILENLDPTQTYHMWYESVKVERIRGVGVQIKYIPGLGPKSNDADLISKLSPKLVESKASKPVWTRQLDEWLEDDNDVEPFIKDNLALTPNEIVELKIRLAQLKTVEYSITSSAVKCIKTGI